jgi:hypothetical protein
MKRLVPFLMAALSAIGCDEEQLRVLTPRIDLCPTAEASEDECGETIDLGRIVVGEPHEAQVFIVNRGDGALDVTGATVDVDTIVEGTPPDTVSAGAAAAMPLTVTLFADLLGEGTATLTVTSSDEDTPTATVQLRWEGIEPPRGDVLLCDAALTEPICASEIDVDFGAVRPTQSTSRLIVVTNGGETDLFVEDLRIDPADGEFALASSSQSVVLAPGEEGSVVVVFTGNGEGRREANLVVVSDDPDTPEAIAHLGGNVGDNFPPTAIAFDSVTGTATATAEVSQLVGIDGTTSSDPEGDPLAFTWTLAGPAGSVAVIEDPSAQNALFVPDVRGTYTVTLVVADSIDQESAPVSVTIDVLAQFKARARVTWSDGGDVDVHLVQSGAALFSTQDARFNNRVVGDAEILDDATEAPGLEEGVLAAPSAGTWEVWAHLFDDAGAGAVDATVSVIVDDAAPAALSRTTSLPATCAAWHVADIVVDAAGAVTVVDVNAAVATICQ